MNAILVSGIQKKLEKVSKCHEGMERLKNVPVRTSQQL